jgi:hypothetical protein
VSVDYVTKIIRICKSTCILVEENGKIVLSTYQTRVSINESNIYRINSYRVFLTRGRDGFITFVPPTPKFQPVYNTFMKAGAKKLSLIAIRI